MTLSASFWSADAATAGLSPLAACLLLRARNTSIVGVLQQSPAGMASVHRGVTADDVLAAIDELSARRLARWWPDREIFAVAGVAAEATGKATVAVERELAALPPDVAAYSRGELDFGMGYSPLAASSSSSSSNSMEHQQPDRVAALPLRLVGQEPKDDLTKLCDHVLLTLTAACREVHGRTDVGPNFTCESNRELIRKLARRRPPIEGARDPDVWTRVIRAQVDSVAGNPATYKYLSLSTLCRPDNFLRLRDRPTGAAVGGGRRPWSPSDWDKE